MSFARFVWVVGGAVVVAGVIGLPACSSSSGGFTQQDGGSTTHDSATGSDTGGGSSGGDTGTGSETSTGMDSGGTGDDGGTTCENPPTLHPETAAGVYCPFSAVSGGEDTTCTAGQHCCETPSAANTPSTCEPLGTACPVAGSIDWQCEEAIDCAGVTGSPICCGTGTPTTETSCGMTWAEWSGFTGTKCAASCPAPGITVCEKTADCTGDAGTTCTPSKAEGNQFGFCGP